MIKPVIRLRFNHPEPSQLRANALAGIMSQGDEGNRISFDEARALVYFTKQGRTRIVHLSACAWVEVEEILEAKGPEPAKK